MKRLDKLGVWDYLIQATNNNAAEIRVITPTTKENREILEQIRVKSQKNNNGSIRFLTGPVTSSGLFIVDDKRYFRAETKNSESNNIKDAISIMIYSNSRSGVDSFKSFFETLWKQSELYEQLAIANEKLILHDRMQTEFINIAAHELRTPIQPILGMTEILKENMHDKETGKITKDELALLMRNALRLERLSSAILQVARIESNSLQLQKETVNLNEIVRDAIEEIKSALISDIDQEYKDKKNQQRIQITFEPKSDLVIVERIYKGCLKLYRTF